MSKRVRRISFILALLLAFTGCLFSCKEEEDEMTGEWDNCGIEDGIPEDTDMNGYEYRVFCRGNMSVSDGYGMMPGEEGATTVDVAVYERNLSVQNRLNCKFKYIGSQAGTLGDTQKEVELLCKTEEYYDFFMLTNNTIVMLRLNQYLCDLNDAEYLNNGDYWWWQDVIAELSVDGTIMNYVVGDINLGNFHKMSAFYFNFDLIEEKLRMKPQDFYNLVNNGQWTIDRVNTLASQCYSDVNGNGEYDDADLFAFPYTGGEVSEQFVWSTRLIEDLYERDNRGVVTKINMDCDDAYSVVEELRRLLRENEGVRQYSHMPSGTFDGLTVQEFASGKYVFLANRLSAACSTHMRDMMVDYGILPYPTLEEGDEYHSYIQNSSSCISVPLVASKNLEMIGIAIEALCSEAARHTTEAFFTMALKGKYTNDVESANMVDIIYESAEKSFLIEYTTAALNITGCASSAIAATSNTYSSLLAGKSGAINALNQFVIECKGGGAAA